MAEQRPQWLSGESFLVRIWWETSNMSGEPLVWRGRVEHVASGRAIYFDDFAELLAFIENRVGSSSLPTAATGGQDKEEERCAE